MMSNFLLRILGHQIVLRAGYPLDTSTLMTKSLIYLMVSVIQILKYEHQRLPIISSVDLLGAC